MRKRAEAGDARREGIPADVGARKDSRTRDSRTSGLLESFPNPHPQRDYLIEHHVHEFTSLCPKTGQPAFNSGFHREAMAVSQHWISIFEPFEHVVTPSASCAAMVKHHLPELFAADSAWHRRARRLSEQTHEFTVFLRDMLGVDAAE